MLQIDDRLGGAIRYRTAQEGEPFMLVDDAIRKCVGFVMYRGERADPPRAGGTFFLGSLFDAGAGVGFIYFVTARHVIEHACKESVDGKIILRLNLKAGGTAPVET